MGFPVLEKKAEIMILIKILIKMAEYSVVSSRKPDWQRSLIHFT